MVIAVVIGVISVALFLIYSNGPSGSGITVDPLNPNGGAVTPNISTYAAQAGFVGNDLVTAVAIALAESKGNARAYNPETESNTPTGKGSYGLWQIYLKEHPEFTGQDLYDPQTNANAAFSVYAAKGNSFTPWTTYKTGAFTAYMDVAQAQVQV